jgi:hypothetical protein
MILNDIRKKLEEVDSNVFYGAVDKKMKEVEWNYIVFNRGPLRIAKGRTGYSDYFDVHIVREEYIPEGLDEQVIEKILEIDGMRLADMDGAYDYIYKDKTDNVIEMLTLRFVRARK